MISLSASGGSVVFTFANSTYYLYGDGTITVPVNSLSLVIDNSNIATFKKAATNDIFVAAPLAEFGMSKAEIEAFYKENMVGSTGGGGGGVTSGEVETMIVSALTDYYDIDEVDDAISAATDDMATQTWVGNQGYITGVDLSNYDTKSEVNTKISTATGLVNSALTAHTADTNVHVTSSEKSTWNAKSDFSGSYNDLTDKPTIPTVPTSNTAFTNDAGYITSGDAQSQIDSSISGKQDTLSAGTGIEISGNVISATGGGSTYTAGTNISIANDTISCTLPISGVTGGLATETGNTTVQGYVNKAFINGGYNNLSGSNMLTFIDGDRNTISNTTDSWSSGGGKGSCIIGSYNNVSKLRNYYIFGYQNSGSTSNLNQEINNYMFMFGKNNKAYNNVESTLGQYNNSVSASTTFGDSGNTLFSVGNGTSNNARHNAFEIRQNGDIYITSGGTDIKLQDNLGGGGGGSYTAGEGINIDENDVISTSYSGYPVFDSGTTTPESNLYNFEGQCLILCPIDCEGSTDGVASFSADGHNYQITFYPETQTYDDNGDSTWQDYFTLDWNNTYGAFMLTTIQPIDASDVGCVRFLTSEIRYSGTTTDGINGALEVATKVDKQLGGLKFVRLTQEEYDALTTKHSDTLYIIVPTFGGLTVYYSIDGQAAQNEITLFNGGGESSGESSGSEGGGALPTTMIVDGVEETPVNTWRFEYGTHIVQYTFEDNTIPQMFLNGIDYVYEIKIGDDITTIADSFAGDGVFAGMPALQKATIGQNVTTIGDYAFNTSTNLSSEGIYVKATTPPTLGSGAFDNTDNCPILVPNGTYGDYISDISWSVYGQRIAELS